MAVKPRPAVVKKKIQITREERAKKIRVIRKKRDKN